jgi:(1->4)-alpha-D-glucan 1-alpha-D-glucosylmutase
VDPDNRRAVDFPLRERLLEDVAARTAAAGADRRALCRYLVETWRDGRVKLYVIREALGLRRDLPALFLGGAYQALQARGERSEHLALLTPERP